MEVNNKEALEFLTDLGAKAAGATEIPTGNPTERVFLVDGQVQRFKVDPPLRNHVVDSLGSFIEACDHYNQNTGKCVVYYDETSVVLVVDDAARRDFVTMPLQYSDLFENVLKLRREEGITHKAFVRLLRHDLAGTGGADDLLPIIRRIEVKSSGNMTADRQHGRDSLGKSVDAVVQGTADIPEKVVLALPVYANDGMEFATEIPFSVDPQPDTATFRFNPLPDAVNIAKKNTMRWLGRQLEQTELPAFYGRFE